jgi:hypothetical protein
MTRDEFDARKDDPCQACGAPIKVEHVLNNNSHQVICTNKLCRQPRRPWGIVVHVQHTDKPRRKDDSLRVGAGLYEVWERFKNRCVVCCRTQAELYRLGIGISRHHVTDQYDHSDVACPIVPVCNACKTLVDARQRETLRFVRLLRELDGGEPLTGSGDGLSGPRVSPDPMRAAGQAPAGALEGLPDDDAHA